MEKNSTPSNEYVVFNIVSSPYIQYANGKPTIQRINIDVAYYAIKKALSQEHLSLIKDTMLNAQWRVYTPEIIIPSVTKDNITGILIEFSKEQVI